MATVVQNGPGEVLVTKEGVARSRMVGKLEIRLPDDEASFLKRDRPQSSGNGRGGMNLVERPNYSESDNSLSDESNADNPLSEEMELTAPDNLGHVTALASEHSLKKIWDTPEEDEAWRDL